VVSIDAKTKLFGLKFSFLFIVCLVLFLILIPFNVVLIFIRTLSRFKLINHFIKQYLMLIKVHTRTGSTIGLVHNYYYEQCFMEYQLLTGTLI